MEQKKYTFLHVLLTAAARMTGDDTESSQSDRVIEMIYNILYDADRKINDIQLINTRQEQNLLHTELSIYVWANPNEKSDSLNDLLIRSLRNPDRKVIKAEIAKSELITA